MTETNVVEKIEITSISKEKILTEKLRKECEIFELAKEYLKCDFDNGLVVWTKVNPKAYCIKIGDVAGGISKFDGYIRIRVQDKLFLAHRFVFYCYHGYLPKCIDHKNRIKDDNQILNLREATDSENNQNKSIAKNNTSGYQGVYFYKSTGKWVAKIYINGKLTHLGYFKTFEEAITVRKAAELLYYPHKCQHN